MPKHPVQTLKIDDVASTYTSCTQDDNWDAFTCLRYLVPREHVLEETDTHFVRVRIEGVEVEINVPKKAARFLKERAIIIPPMNRILN